MYPYPTHLKWGHVTDVTPYQKFNATEKSRVKAVVARKIKHLQNICNFFYFTCNQGLTVNTDITVLTGKQKLNSL